MGWNDVLATGRGWTEYLLQIEGFDYGFVTNAGMAKTSGSVRYLNGLLRESLQIGADVDIAEAKLTAQSVQFQIVDLSEAATAAFVRRPTYEAKIRRELATTENGIYVSTVANLVTGSFIFLGTEALRVAGISADLGFLLVLRGQLNSGIRKHVLTTEYGGTLSPTVTDVPLSLDHRRAKLFAYGEGDDLQGGGTLIWQGITYGNPELSDVGTWTVSAYPITELFKSEIGGNFGTFGLRGIHFPHENQWETNIYRKSNDQFNLLDIGTPIKVALSGFFASPSAMIEEMNTQTRLSGAAAGWPTETVPAFGLLGNGSIGMYFTTDVNDLCMVASSTGGTPREEPMAARGLGSQFVRELHFTSMEPTLFESNGTIGGTLDFSSSAVTNTVANRSYVQTVRGRDVAFPAIFNYGKKFYLDSRNLPSAATSILMIRQTEAGERTYALRGFSINATNRYIAAREAAPLFEGPSGRSEGYEFWINRNDDTKFQLGLEVTQSGSLHNFLTDLVGLAPDYVNQGMMPDLSGSDIDLDDIGERISQMGMTAYTAERLFSFSGQPAVLEDVIAEECKLVGALPSLTGDWRFTIRKVRFASATEATSSAIGHSEVLTDDNFPTYSKNAEKIRNYGILRYGFDPREGEYRHAIEVGYLDSLALNNGKKSEWEIAPQSMPIHRLDISDIENILIRPLTVLGVPMVLITVDVPLTRFNLRLGDAISLSSRQIPNATLSQRGINSLAGIVKGFKWDLNRGRGTLQILSSEETYRGYSPSAKIISGSAAGAGGSGSVWNLRLGNAHYVPASERDGSYFRVGEEVEAIQDNAWVPARISGTITTVNSTDPYEFQVTFYTTIAAGAGSLFTSSVLRYTDLHRTTLTDRQKIFCWISSGSLSGSVATDRDKLGHFGP